MQKKLIGEGINGKCYELETGEVLKRFKLKRDISELKKYKRFLEYENDSVFFPYKFFTDRKYINAYISKKAPGKQICNCLPLYSFNDISRDLFKLERDILLVSSGNILMCDNHSENMLYDGSKFSIIDVDEYFFYDTTEMDKNYVYIRNITKIENAIFEVFCDYIDKCNLSSNDKFEILRSFRKYIFWDYGPSLQVLEYKNILENVLKEEVKVLDDVKKIIKRA